MLKQDYYNDFFEIGQQKINFSFFELSLPDDDPVYTLKKVMEELDFSGLLACYPNKGRTGFNPIMLYAVVTYANMRGVRAVDRIVDLCQRDLAFIWLTKGQKPQRDVFYDFKGKKLTGEVLDELNYQFMRRLEKEGFLTLKELYIDGTKLEANANRYTFVWRGSLNYHLAGLLYLKENRIRSFIKLQDHEKRKTRVYKEDIGKYYNMTYAVSEDEHYYICHDGRELRHIRTERKEQDGYTQTVEVYGCADCSECEYKSKCLYRYNPEKNPDQNKVMKINERWEELREESNMNIQSEEGILKRQTRSIQTEGHFGDIKENENFRRFNYRSKEKVYKEFMLYAIGRNIMKYHRFLRQEIEKFEGKKEQEAA